MHKASVTVVFGREHETRRISAPHLRLIQGGLANHKPEPDERQINSARDKTAEFKRWLALFFIEKGNYRITDKGYEELAPSIQTQEIKEAVARRVEEMIREGRAEELYQNGYVDRPDKFDWRSREVRVEVIQKLIEVLGKSPREIIGDDFNNNGLSGLLVGYYKSSPYEALFEAGLVTQADEAYMRSRRHKQ